MPHVSIRVLEGLERGKIFKHLSPPISIGREEDNQVQLNDERISRVHAKLHYDDGHLILTDLGSTNGTRVNGHPIQIRILRDGDLVTIGRCLLQVSLAAEGHGVSEPTIDADDAYATAYGEQAHDRESSGEIDFDGPFSSADPDPAEMFPDGAPPLPEGLRPLQRAQIHDLFHFLHVRLADVLTASEEIQQGQGSDNGSMRLAREDWLRLTDLQLQLAVYLRNLTEPSTD